MNSTYVNQTDNNNLLQSQSQNNEINLIYGQQFEEIKETEKSQQQEIKSSSSLSSQNSKKKSSISSSSPSSSQESESQSQSFTDDKNNNKNAKKSVIGDYFQKKNQSQPRQNKEIQKLQKKNFTMPNQVQKKFTSAINKSFWQEEIEEETQKNSNRFREDPDCLDFTHFDPNKNDEIKKNSKLKQGNSPSKNQINDDNDLAGFNDLMNMYNDDEDDYLKKENLSGMENGRYSSFYWKRSMIIEYCHLIFTGIMMGLALLYYDIDSDKAIGNDYIDIILLAMGFIMILNLIVTYFRYRCIIDLEIRQMLLPPTATISNSGLRTYYLFETFFLTLQPYPYLNQVSFKMKDYYNDLEFDFKLNWILTILCMNRIFVFIRILLKSNKFMTTRGNRLCQMYGCKASYKYIIKCYFKDLPLESITILFVGSVFYFAFLLKICESPLNEAVPDNSMDFTLIENCIWCTVITMTTVGYGDYYARTLPGRCLTIIIAIWGNLIVSMLVVVLTNLLDFKNSENKALNIIHRLVARSSVKDKAISLITALAKFHKIIERRRESLGVELDDKYLGQKNSKLKKLTDDFIQLNRVLKSMNDKQNLYEEIGRQFEYVQNEIKYMKDSQQKLCTSLQEAYKQMEGDDQMETDSNENENNYYGFEDQILNSDSEEEQQESLFASQDSKIAFIQNQKLAGVDSDSDQIIEDQNQKKNINL